MSAQILDGRALATTIKSELKLRVARPEEETKLEFIILLTVQTMNYLSSGRHRVAL